MLPPKPGTKRGTNKTTKRPAAANQTRIWSTRQTQHQSRRHASSRRKNYRDELTNSEESYTNNSPSDDDSDEYQRKTPKSKHKKKKISPNSDFLARRKSESYKKSNPLKICIRYAYDSKGSSSRVPKFPKADKAYDRDFKSGLRTDSTYQDLLEY